MCLGTVLERSRVSWTRKLDVAAVVAVLAAIALALVPAAGLTLHDHWWRQAPPLLLGTALVAALLPRALEQLGWDDGFGPVSDARAGYARIVVLSASALLIELAVIRWVGAEVRAFAYFKNFLLVSAFLGFGLGFALAGRARSLFTLAVVGLPALAALVLVWNDANLYPAQGREEATFGLQEATGWRSLLFMGGMFLLSVVAFFGVIVLTFVGLTQEVGRRFASTPRVPAYAANLAGSLLGVLGFDLLCATETAPPLWIVAGMAPITALLGSARARATWLASLALTAGLAHAVDRRESGADVQHVWSPYYRVSVARWSPTGEPRDIGWSVSVNRVFMAHGGVTDPALNQVIHRRPMPPSIYDMPFLFAPHARRVLVLGAGLGNDLAAAVRVLDPERVVGVELDPAIARFGALLHPEAPHRSPAVELVVDDARHFLESTAERFDLVLISSVDSHTLLSAYTQLRTDNFLYTREAFESVRRILAPDGVFVVTYAADLPWVVQRIAAAQRAAFGIEPVLGARGHVLCAVGPDLAARVAAQPLLSAWLGANRLPPAPPDVDHPTDDRPFLTIAGRRLPTIYIVSIAVIVGLTLASLRAAELPARRLDVGFAALGAGFLLAETRAVTVCGLLFGVTWQAYAAAIAVVLVALIAGTLAAGRVRPARLWPWYAAVVAAIAASHVALEVVGPPGDLGLRVVFAAVTLGPTFLLGSFVFAAEFARVEDDQRVPVVLASNLVGSVAGGLLEYQSIVLGIGSLSLTAALLYVVAALARRR